nr:matrixin family metalloprotease [Evansella caseinilytica]
MNICVQQKDKEEILRVRSRAFAWLCPLPSAELPLHRHKGENIENDALGLGHSSNSNAVMNTSRDRSKIYTPKTDDLTGIKKIYD